MENEYIFWSPEHHETIAWKVPYKTCLTCCHCTDVFWDYSSGPYMFFCELEKEMDDNKHCDFWESDGIERDCDENKWKKTKR